MGASMLEPEGFSAALRFFAARPGDACRKGTPFEGSRVASTNWDDRTYLFAGDLLGCLIRDIVL